MPTIVQFVTTLDYGDAISDEVIMIDDALRRRGYSTAIYFQHAVDRMRVRAAVYHQFRTPPAPWGTLYHHSIGSEVCSFVTGLKCPKVMIYHNITPPEYFYGTNDVIAELMHKGRVELPLLAPHYDLALGDSEFNRRDLETAGFKLTGVLPLIMNFDKYRTSPDSTVQRRFDDGRTNLLYVGRIAPNKRQEDVIKVFYFYKQLDPAARLILVGSDANAGTYRRWLVDLMTQLKLPDVIFTGHVELRELLAYYQTASVFVSMSEHEGFGAPLVESMIFDVPIVALATSAVPETLGGSGVLVKRKDYMAIAALVRQIVHDEGMRQHLIAGGRRRVHDFEPARLIDRLETHLKELIQ